MPPRKKARLGSTSGAGLASVIAADAPAASMREGCGFQQTPHLSDSASTIEYVGEDAATVVSDSTAPWLPDEHGKCPFPILDGGTFITIAQRAQRDGSEWLLNESTTMLHQAGLLTANDVMEFKQQFLTLSDTEWPPEFGEVFQTSLLAWSFDDSSFWRGKDGVAMSEVIGYAKSMALTRFREGLEWGALQSELVVARFAERPPEDLPPDRIAWALLKFGDGSQKMLAAFMVWLALLLTWRKHGAECFENPLVMGWISSFLRVPTMIKATDTRSTPLESLLSRIVAQNINAKVQPITSYGWACILKQVVLKEGSSFEECLSAYNTHPDVVAHDRSETGSGTIALDNRKKQGVRNFMDRTCPLAFQEIAKSCNEMAFGQGPFGEAFACCNICFLQSKANLDANPQTDETDHPMTGEPFLEVDWQLPMTPAAQLLLFQKVRAMYARSTAGIPVQNKKKYRLNAEELVCTRNLCVLFSSVFAFFRKKIPEEEAIKWENNFIHGSSFNEDFLALLEVRPTKVALSMLKSKKLEAERLALEKQSVIHAAVSVQKEAVTEAQWKWFNSALRSDQALLTRVQAVPMKIKAALHAKSVAHRQAQADAGQKAADAKISADEVALLGWVDMNAPHARNKEACQALCKGIATINEIDPALCASILILPDYARGSSIRGLFDEEKQLFEELYSLCQNCECRWVEVYARESRRADQRSNARRFGLGRVITSSQKIEDNKWLNSELSVYGIQCESKTASGQATNNWLRKRAQRGIEMLLEAALRHTGVSAALVINLTGYVEELGVAAINLRVKETMNGEGGVNLKKLYYMSPHTLDNPENVKYGKARICRELIDLWIDKKLSYEKDSIDCHQYLESLDSMGLQVLVRCNDQFKVHPDHVKQWTEAGGEYGRQFASLQKSHESKFQGLLQSIVRSSGAIVPTDDQSQSPQAEGGDRPQQAPAQESEQGPELKSFASFEALNSADSIQVRCASEIAGVELLKGSSGKIYVMSDKSRILAKHQLLGGFGTGKYVPAAELDTSMEGKFVAFDWSEGDRTLLQVDLQSVTPEQSGIETMTLYRYLVMLERQKRVTSYQISYADVGRVQSRAQDSFEITPKNSHLYRTMLDPSKPLTCKSFFHDAYVVCKNSAALMPIFRWRFDRVHHVTKVQKPYVVTRVPVQLEAAKPMEL
ncbi:unnamed protein product [Durusdinium trenchii]|uniref:Uncharacterized protein n=1 Tax=Durusdinium trenchii TaxID=1381693 RepID=A0ABP0L8I2_9DINO